MATGNPKLKWEVSSTYKERTVMWLAVSISRNVFMFGDSYPQFSLEANSKVHCSAKILLRHFRHFPLLANKQRCHSVSLKELNMQLFTQSPDPMRLLDLPTRLSVSWRKRYYKQHNNNMTLGHWINCVAQYQGDLELCLDVGCGNGQCSGLFSSSFRKVLATDISPSQIEVAKTFNYPTNVEFQ
jgi:hypothetical protein